MVLSIPMTAGAYPLWESALQNKTPVGRQLPLLQQIPQATIWGYNNSLVIAQVTHARADQIFHTSFEDQAGDAAISEGNARTGKRKRTGNILFQPHNVR